MRGIWFSGLDDIRIGDGRKWRIAGIFDRWRRQIGNRTVRWWQRRHIVR
jgi:hypothetical protein